MPNTVPPVTDRERWEAKASLAHGRLAVDVVLFGSARSARSIRSLAPVAGGLKLYLSPTTEVDDGFDPANSRRCWRPRPTSGLSLSVHAEWPAAFSHDPTPPTSSEGWNGCALPPRRRRRSTGCVRHRPPSGSTSPTSRSRKARSESPRRTFPARRRPITSSCRPVPTTPPSAKTNPPLRSEPRRRALLWAGSSPGRIPSWPATTPRITRTRSRCRSTRRRAGSRPWRRCCRSSSTWPAPAPSLFPSSSPPRWSAPPGGSASPSAGSPRDTSANMIAVDFRSRRRIQGGRLRSPRVGLRSRDGTAVFPHWHARDGVTIVDGGEFVGAMTGRSSGRSSPPGVLRRCSASESNETALRSGGTGRLERTDGTDEWWSRDSDVWKTYGTGETAVTALHGVERPDPARRDGRHHGALRMRQDDAIELLLRAR